MPVSVVVHFLCSPKENEPKEKVPRDLWAAPIPCACRLLRGVLETPRCARQTPSPLIPHQPSMLGCIEGEWGTP